MDKQEGGEFIAKGAYGCIFHPNVKCDGFPVDDNWVSKIIHKDSIEDEWTIINNVLNLSKIDKNSDFIIYPVHKCNLNFKNEKEKEKFLVDNRCVLNGSILIDNKFSYLNNNFVNLIIPYGGVDLYKHRMNNIKKDEFLDLNTEWKSHLNLLKSVYLLNKNNICARDIKPPNVLFHNNTLSPHPTKNPF